eukprot:scaffold5281_cov127-Cylindrotheca_fusiformis.AAC.15
MNGGMIHFVQAVPNLSFNKSCCLQASGEIVGNAFLALNATVSIDKALPNCKLVATARVYDPEAENLFGSGFLSCQVQVSQRVNVTSSNPFDVNEITSLVEDGFDVTTGGQTLFRTLLLEHPMFHTILVVKVRRSLTDSQLAPSATPSFSRNPTSAPSSAPTISSTPTFSTNPSSRPTSSRNPTSSPTFSRRPTTGPTFSMIPTTGPTLSALPSSSRSPTEVPSLSSAPSALPSSVPSSMPSVSPSLYPSRSPSLLPSAMPSSLPTTRPSRSSSGGNGVSKELQDGRDEYRFAENSLAIAAIVGSLAAVCVSSAFFLWFRYHRKVGVIRDRPEALTTKDGQNKVDRSSIMPRSSASPDLQSFDGTAVGDRIAQRQRMRAAARRQIVQIDSIDENSLYTSPLTTKMDNTSSRHSRMSNLSSLGEGPLDYEVASLFHLANTSEMGSGGNFNLEKPRNNARHATKAPRLKELRRIGPIDLDSDGTKAGSPKTDAARAKQVSEALCNQNQRGSMWGCDADWVQKAEGSIRSFSSLRSRSSRRGIRRNENDSSHNKSLDGTESSLVVSHISDKDFVADMQSVESAGSQSSATSSKSYSSRSARQRGPLADFLESMMKARRPYLPTSIPPLTPEGEEFDPDSEDSGGTSKHGSSVSSSDSSEEQSSSASTSTNEANEIHSMESSDKASDRMESASSSYSSREGHREEFEDSPASSEGSSPGQSLTMLQMEKFDDMDRQGWERGEKDLMVDFSKDADSASSESTGRSPRAWLLDAVEQTLGPRSMSADMESLGGKSSHSHHASRRRNSMGKQGSIAPQFLEQEKKRLEMQLSSLENSQTAASSLGASSVAGSFCTTGSKGRTARVSRKKRIVVLVPPGKLGVVLGNRQGSKGTVVAEIRKTSVLHGMLSQGDKLVAVDGEDVSDMTLIQITALLTSKASHERRLTILTSVQHQQP